MIRYAFSLLIVLMATASLAQPASEAELVEFGKELRSVIMREDVEGLIQYMEYGVATPNDFYRGKDVRKKLHDKTSWLYKRFFVGTSSAKAFFQRYDNVAVDVAGSCDYHVVSYVSADGRERYDCPVLVYKKRKKIFIGELPPCPAP